MTMTHSFLGGAKDRLLPPSIPFRYFGAAVLFHIMAWVMLFVGANDLAGFRDGPGYILSALHLLTLGVLTMTAMGASYQLLPVATGQSMAYLWPVKLGFWAFVPGTLLLSGGMIDGHIISLYLGGCAALFALLVFAYLTARNLTRAGTMPVVVSHGWAALIALVGFAGLGLALLLDYDLGFLTDHQAVALAHMILASFGFMGLLVFGFSQILVPMFLLSRAPETRPGYSKLGLAMIAILLALVGVFTDAEIWLVGAMGIGLVACGIYLWLMYSVYLSRMRKRVDSAFIIISLSWMFMMVGMIVGFSMYLGLQIPNGMTLFGFLMLVGWLLTFLTGVLQRIIPFLASMHTVGEDGMPILLSELSPQKPLRIHGVCHFMAIIFCSAGIIFDMSILVRIGAGFGFIGAIAFAGFTSFVISKLPRGSS